MEKKRKRKYQDVGCIKFPGIHTVLVLGVTKGQGRMIKEQKQTTRRVTSLK